MKTKTGFYKALVQTVTVSCFVLYHPLTYKRNINLYLVSVSSAASFSNFVNSNNEVSQYPKKIIII